VWQNESVTLAFLKSNQILSDVFCDILTHSSLWLACVTSNSYGYIQDEAVDHILAYVAE